MALAAVAAELAIVGVFRAVTASAGCRYIVCAGLVAAVTVSAFEACMSADQWEVGVCIVVENGTFPAVTRMAAAAIAAE